MFFSSIEDRVYDAVRSVAARSGDVAEQEHLIEFYRTRAATVDPHVDWNTYADLRQRQYTHETELAVCRHRLQKALAKMEKLS